MNHTISKRISIWGFLLSLVIAAYHVGMPIHIANQNDAKIGWYLLSTINDMAVIAMSWFFFVSGYLHFRGLNWQSYLPKLRRRIAGLLVPYLTWQVIVSILYELEGKAWSLNAFIKTTFLFGQWPADGALWYLYAIFWLAVFSPFLMILLQKRMVRSIMFVLLVIGLVWFETTDNSLAMRIRYWGYVGHITTFLVSYVVGAYLGMKNISEPRWRDFILVIALAVAGAGIGLLDPALGVFILIRLLPVLMLFVVPVERLPFDPKLTTIAFLVYAVHPPILSWLIGGYSYIFQRLNISPLTANMLLNVVIVMSDVLIACGIYELCNRCMPKLLEILTGNRRK